MNNMNDDFKNFQNTPTSNGPKPLPMAFLKKIEKDINPGIFLVFSKVLLIHAVTASLSLLICPQFGLQYFRHNLDVTEFAYAYGEFAHHLACGFMFMGGSILAAVLLLTRDEVRKLRKYRTLAIGSLILVSFCFFAFLSPQEIFEGIASVWILGGILSSSLFLELGWKLRIN